MDIKKNVDKIIGNVDILSHISKHVHLDAKGKGLCPFHNDTNPSFYVSREKGIFKCFSCRVGGDVIKFEQLIHDIDFRTAMENLSKEYSVSIDSFDDGVRAIDYSWTAINNLVSEYTNVLLTNSIVQALDYMKKRGISLDAIQTYRAGVCPKDKSLLNLITRKFEGFNPAQSPLFYKDPPHAPMLGSRITFPLFDYQGKNVIGFAGRAIRAEFNDDKELISFTSKLDGKTYKYWNSPDDNVHQGGYTKDTYLYGYHLAKGYNKLYVVEGYFDCLSMYTLGIKNVVALGGTSMTPRMFNLIKDKRIVLCLDNDEAGFEGALSIFEKYGHHADITFGVYPSLSKDANDMLILDGTNMITEVLYDEYLGYGLIGGIYDITTTENKYNLYKKILKHFEFIDASEDSFLVLAAKRKMLDYFGLNPEQIQIEIKRLEEEVYAKSKKE